MKEKKIFLISLIVITIILVGSVVINKNIQNNKEIKINKNIKEDSSISKPIKNLLYTFFNMEISTKKEDCKNIVSDSKLAKIYNLKFNSFVDFNKIKENKIITIEIKNIQENKKNSYLVSFIVTNEFNYNERTEKSFTQEYYLAEIIKKDNAFYINKLVNHFDYIQTIDDNSILQSINDNSELIPIDIFSKKTYDLILNNQIFNLNEYNKKNSNIF